MSLLAKVTANQTTGMKFTASNEEGPELLNERHHSGDIWSEHLCEAEKNMRSPNGKRPQHRRVSRASKSEQSSLLDDSSPDSQLFRSISNTSQGFRDAEVDRLVHGYEVQLAQSMKDYERKITLIQWVLPQIGLAYTFLISAFNLSHMINPKLLGVPVMLITLIIYYGARVFSKIQMRCAEQAGKNCDECLDAICRHTGAKRVSQADEIERSQYLRRMSFIQRLVGAALTMGLLLYELHASGVGTTLISSSWETFRGLFG